MTAEEKMQEIRTYIEEHLDENLTAQQLADMAGFTLYYFCHKFSIEIGTSVIKYLRYRRLDTISEELLRGDDIQDTAARHGYTVKSFYRAFHNRYGITPLEYKNTKGGLTLLQPVIEQCEAFRAVGYYLKPPERDDFDIMDYAAYWSGNDFTSVSPADYKRLDEAKLGEIGMWTDPDPVTGEFCYVFGPVVKDFSFVPKGMVTVEVPAAKYAVFTVPEAVAHDALGDNVRRLWSFIFQDWLETSGEVFDEEKCSFEFYHGKISYMYIPIK